MAFYVKKVPGRTVFCQNREYLYFGGTSYLGLQNHPEFEGLLLKNIKEFGMSHGASRKSNIRLDVYDQAETYMARWSGAATAMLVSSGYLAGQLLRDYFDDDGFTVFHMPGAHSALSRKKDRFFDLLPDLKKAIEKELKENNSKTPVLFFDSITFSDENYPRFEFLKTLALDRMILIADDSHGIGIVGEKGAGAFPILKELEAKELLLCASLSKGPTVQAGVILGKQGRIDDLKNSLPYGGSSPPSPASMATLLEADSIYVKQREKLANNVDLFLKTVKNRSFFNQTKGHPAFSFRNPNLTEFLENNGVLVTHFNYPNPDGALLSRIVISAGHTSENIEILSGLINEFLTKNG